MIYKVGERFGLSESFVCYRRMQNRRPEKKRRLVTHDLELCPDTAKNVAVNHITEEKENSIPSPLKVQLCHMPLLPPHRPPPRYLQRPIHIH